MISPRLWQVMGWTMLHYLWVGAALGAVALLARHRLRPAAANVRYLFAVGSLLLLSAAPAVITVAVMQNTASDAPRVPLAVESAIQPEAMPFEEMRPTAAAGTPGLAVAGDLTVPPSQSHRSERLLAALNLAAMCLPWLWVCGAPLSFALTTAGLLGAERLRRQSRPLEDARISEMCRQLAATLKISYRVGVAVCDRIAGPILVGVFWPMILLPAAALAGWDPQQLEMVLLHELAHVRRYDNLVNLLQRIVESVLFFQPMVWIVSGWVRREREHCCDELVVACTHQPQAYAEMLVTLAETLSQNRLRSSSLVHPQMVSSMAERPLVARIRRILKKEEQAMQVSRKAVGLVFAGLLALALTIGGYCSLSSYAEGTSAAPAAEDALATPPAQTPRTDSSFHWRVVDSSGMAYTDGFDLNDEPGPPRIFLPGYEWCVRPPDLKSLAVTDEQKERLRKVMLDHESEQDRFYRDGRTNGSHSKDFASARAKWAQEEQQRVDKQLEEILTPQQMHTIRERKVYSETLHALLDSKSDEKLGLTTKQSDHLRALSEEYHRQAKRTSREFADKELAILTSQQRTKLREAAIGPLGNDLNRTLTLAVEGEADPIRIYALDPYPDFSEEEVQKELGLTTTQQNQVRNILGNSSTVTEQLLRNMLQLSPEGRKERQNTRLTYVGHPIAWGGLSAEQRRKQKEKCEEWVKEDRRARWNERQNQPLMEMSVALRKEFEAILTPEQLASYQDMAVRHTVYFALDDLIVAHQIEATRAQMAELRRMFLERVNERFRSDCDWGKKMFEVLTPAEQEKLRAIIDQQASPADGRPTQNQPSRVATGLGTTTGANDPSKQTSAEGHAEASRPESKLSPGTMMILRELDKPTTVECVEYPLKDMVGNLADLHAIKIRFDHEALGEAGIELDAPITRELKGVTLDSALHLELTGDLDLIYLIRDGVLLITTESHRKRLLQQGAIDPAAYPMPKKAAAMRKLADVLKKTGSVSCNQTPLREVCDLLAAEYGCNIELDRRSLDDVGVEPDVPCTMTLKNVSLDSALRQLLTPHGLKYVVRDEVLLITGAEEPKPAAPKANAPSGKQAAAEPTRATGSDNKSDEQALEEFKRLYILHEGEVWKHIPPPFSPARAVYYRITSPTQATSIPEPPSVMIFRWRDGKLKNWGMSFGSGDLYFPLRALADIYPEEIEGDKELLKSHIEGDWIIREGAAKKEILSQLEGILRKQCKLPVKLSLRDVERKVIVATGKFQLAAGTDPFHIQIYGKTLITDGTGGGGGGDVDEFLKWVGMFIHSRVINKAASPSKNALAWHYNERSPSTEQKRAEDHDPASVLKHLTEQTGLTFKEESRSVPVLFVERAK